MENVGGLFQEKKFKNLEEEVAFLREKVAEKEAAEKSFEKNAKEAVSLYAALPNETVLHPSYELPKKEVEAIVLDLAPESHDGKMEELLALLSTKGIKNTLAIVEAMDNPHIEDDFHRFLVQYLKKGFLADSVKEKSPLFQSLAMTLYEVSLPRDIEEAKESRSLKELISKMEQFYAGMLSIGDKGNRLYFTFEIANCEGSREVVFYLAIPDEKKSLFEKQILSLFPDAKVFEKKDDYNIFSESGVTLASHAKLVKSPALPIKLYENFDYDPLNVILNAFSKMEESGEGAAVQFIFRPAADRYTKKFKKAFDDLGKGKPAKEVLAFRDGFGSVLKSIGKEFFSSKKKDEDKKPADENLLKAIHSKIESPIVEINLRITVCAKEEADAKQHLANFESAFNQFENPLGNSLVFKRVEKSALRRLIKNFSFRFLDEDEVMPISLRELTTMFHFPEKIEAAPELRQAKAGTAPAPVDMAKEGTLLGVNRNRNIETKTYITPDDRLRHMYVIGQTGTGKTTLLKNMIAQDIANGEGVCFIDPHGSDIQDILSVVPKHRYEDVIYFDPGYAPRPMALNMLEFDHRFPEQKTFVVNEMLSIFNKLFDMKTAGGPMFEQYFRNSVLLVAEDPESGGTLLDVSRVLANKAFRELKLSRCKNPIVVQFWKEVAEKAGGEASLANIVPYITSKFDVFLSNDIMRPVVAQEKSSFNFREIMDNRKILLVNLSKGRLGDINANLIGLVLVGKILMAALSRVDSLGKNLPPFYLYIDEFQNVTTDSIAQILSEARKYKLSLTIAHQFIAQLEEKIKDAVFGNVGSIAAFRVGSEDAEFLEKQFAPVFTARDIMNLDNRNAYLKLLVHGRPVKPFNIETLPPPAGQPEILEKLKELSYLKFGRSREEVEAEILQKYQSEIVASPRSPSLTVPQKSAIFGKD